MCLELTRGGLVGGAVVLLILVSACDEKKPTPAVPSATGTASAAEPATPAQTAVVAYPPGMGPPADAGIEAPPLPKTGLCAFQESSYDGQDTRSNEKLVVKIKDDRIVAAEYTYRGSYALDGKTESLSIPLQQNAWIPFELPMTSGTKEFKLKVKDNFVEFKGTAIPDADGNCVWEKPAEDAGAAKPKKK